MADLFTKCRNQGFPQTPYELRIRDSRSAVNDLPKIAGFICALHLRGDAGLHPWSLSCSDDGHDGDTATT